MRTVYLSFVAEEDFNDFVRLCDDTDPAKANYAEYTKGVDDFCKETARVGNRAVKVRIDPNELVAWCAKANRKVDSSARSHYAALVGSGKERGSKHQ